MDKSGVKEEEDDYVEEDDCVEEGNEGVYKEGVWGRSIRRMATKGLGSEAIHVG